MNLNNTSKKIIVFGVEKEPYYKEGKLIVEGGDNFTIAEEQKVPKGNMSAIRLIFLYIFSRRFRWLFSETVKYALMHHESYRGEKASSVLMFSNLYCYPDKLWRK